MTSALPKYLKVSDQYFDLRKAWPFEIPIGYDVYQLLDDYAIWGAPGARAYGGNPAVVPLENTDRPDVWFTKDWQFYLYGINFYKDIKIKLSSVIALEDNGKALMNGTGVSSGRNNYLTGNTGYEKDPCTDKFRTFNLNIHFCREIDNSISPLALDGSKPPPMAIDPATGQRYARPQTLEEIDINKYAITPATHLPFFCVCTNVKWKPDTQTLDYGPFDNGIIRDDIATNPTNIQCTLFPFVTTRQNVMTPKSWWRKLTRESILPSVIRRG